MIQREVLIATLLTEGSVTKTAEKLKCSTNTVRSYMAENGFDDDFNKAKTEVLNGVCNRIRSELLEGVEIISQIMRDEKTAPQIKINSFQILMNTFTKLNEQTEILSRIDELEKRLSNEQDD